jgi:hypothetical protein
MDDTMQQILNGFTTAWFGKSAEAVERQVEDNIVDAIEVTYDKR